MSKKEKNLPTPGDWQVLHEGSNYVEIGIREPFYSTVATVCKFAYGPKEGRATPDYAPGNLNVLLQSKNLLSELEEAHQIISKMLNMMTDEQIAELSKLDMGEGAVRYHVRKDVIAAAKGEGTTSV